MPRMRGIAALTVAVGLFLATPRARAYDHSKTHPWITRMAVDYLVAAYPGQYDELLEYVDQIADGSHHEDDLFLDGDDDPQTLRVMRHFFRPVDEAGLTMYGQTFPSSYEWATGGGHGNEWDWDAGISAYAADDLEEAYFVLGHVVHLVQDITVPAHTHLDVHGPPSGDDYEGYCAGQSSSQFDSALPLPPAGSPIPDFADPHDAWRRTAEAAYWRNLYPGAVNGSDSVTGTIADMFPSLSWSWIRETWTIDAPPVGDLGSDFLESEPGHYYFENTEHAAAVDRVSFDPERPRTMRFGPNTSNASMVELIARDMIPVAVLHSAGVMKLYIDTARAASPQVVSANDDAGNALGGCNVGADADPSALLLILLALALVTWRRP